MSAKKKQPSMLFIVSLIAALLIMLSGCIQLEKTGPSKPDVGLFELYVSDVDKTKLSNPVFSPGETVYFTIQYQDVENFQPLVVTNIEYDFSRLKPEGMDVHMGFPVDELIFLDGSHNPVSQVLLNPGESVVLSMTIPEDSEKWDEILAKSLSNQSVNFNLVIKIQDLAVPLQSNTLTVQV